MSKTKNIINLTQNAIAQLRNIEKHNNIIRFSVEGGGCVGAKQNYKIV